MKMNVLHLHLTDAQSFPYVNPTFPELSGQGAFDSTSAVYTHDDLTEVISLAESLGVIVLPEFDMPVTPCIAYNFTFCLGTYCQLGNRVSRCYC